MPSHGNWPLGLALAINPCVGVFMVIERLTRRQRLFVGMISGLILLTYQNCAPKNFGIDSANLASKVMTTMEDTAATFRLQTEPQASRFSITGYSGGELKTAHGKVTNFNPDTGSFDYMPDENYFGEDSFEFTAVFGRDNAITRLAPLVIAPVNDMPWIEVDSISFEMNTPKDFDLPGLDIEDNNPGTWLDPAGSMAEMPTLNGRVRRMSWNRFRYTPNTDFRGMDQYEFVVKDNEGGWVRHMITLNVGNPFHGLEPALAVRASGCVTCHAQVDSKYITDFGYGSPYFFAGSSNPFTNAPQDFYGDHHASSWSSSIIRNDIIVPANAALGRPLRPLVQALEAAPISLPPSYKDLPPFAATVDTLKKYLQAWENIKNPANPTRVVEKQTVFIGAPNTATLIARTGIGSNSTKFIKNNQSSPALSGLDNRGAYFQNAATGLVCDGDLTIQGTLFLKDLILKSTEGCRIYVTGAIFLQGPITYQKINAALPDKNNLQLVSSRWISLGVGTSHCETAATVGHRWYYDAAQVGTNIDPFSHRINIYSGFTRSASTPALLTAEKAFFAQEINKIPTGQGGLEDASCRGGQNPRQVSFNRLLLNAPRVDSRYTGQFTGVIIAEVPLLSLSNFSFRYDQTFNNVPVLPLLQPQDFLVVQ